MESNCFFTMRSILRRPKNNPLCAPLLSLYVGKGDTTAGRLNLCISPSNISYSQLFGMLKPSGRSRSATSSYIPSSQVSRQADLVFHTGAA